MPCGGKFHTTDKFLGHYSVEKAAIICGLGSDSVWQIGVDKEGRMLIPGRTSLLLRSESGQTGCH